MKLLWIKDKKLRNQALDILTDKSFSPFLSGLDNHDRNLFLEKMKDIPDMDIEDYKEMIKMFEENPYNQIFNTALKQTIKMVPLPQEMKDNKEVMEFVSQLNVMK